MANGSKKEDLSDGFWVGDWFAEPMLNRMVREEEHVQLEPKVMDVLQLMAERPGKAVTKEAFMERVWTDTVVTDDVLSRCISQLRKVLGDDAHDPDYIETIRKTGYRLIAPVRVPEVEQAAESTPVDRDASSASASASATTASEDASFKGRLQGTMRNLSDELTALSSDGGTGEKWIVVAGGMFERRWVLITGGLILLALIAVGLAAFLRPSLLPTAQMNDRLEAMPLTSFPGQERDPALSPDGRQVAFIWSGEQASFDNIYLMQEGADTPLRLTNVEADEWSPAWSPDGQQVAFVRDLDNGCGVFVVSSIGGNERQLAHFPHRHVQSLAWSPHPTQNRLVLALQQPGRQSQGLYQLPVQADTLIQLTRPPALSMGDTDPAFSPSGNRIAFVRTLIDGIQDIYVVSANGGTATRVTSDSTRIAGFDWTPSGKEIVFASDREGDSGLWRVPVSGGDPEWITTASEGTQIQYPTLAHQDARLAFAQQSGQVNIWKVQHPTDYADASAERLISSTRWDSNPDISPDGARLAFASRRSGYPEIWTATPAGTELKQLTSLEAYGTQTPRWSPDGAQIAFASRTGGHSDIYVINREGFRPHRVTRHSSEDLFPTWSRDGRALYFTSNRSGSWEIWTIPVEGGKAVQVTQGGATMAQEHPDGEVLYFIRPDTTGIWAVPLADVPRTLALASSDSAAAPPDAQGGTQRIVPRRVVPSLQARDRSNWQVRPRGIYFLRRDPDGDMLAFYRFSTEQVSPVFLVEDVPREPSISVAPNAEWFVYTRTELSESDVLLVENFQ
jgi:Tol biopolymer transport system component/DNA-binding winged helix-turn-helix (wHTH) protein